MAEHGIEAIDLVAVNLYPFAATVARPGCTFDDAVENIDIGGPAMVRASAKNHERVTIIVDPLDYGTVLAEIDREGGSVSAETRLRLATKAFAHTAQYDATVAAYLDRAARPSRGRVPRTARAAVPQAPRPALRRESAPAGGVLRRHGLAGRIDRLGVAAAGQGAVVQQPRRRGHRVRVRAAVRGAGLRDRQARQPVRRVRRGHATRGLRPRVPHRSRPRPSAASSRSTVRSTARRRGRSSSGSSSR